MEKYVQVYFNRQVTPVDVQNYIAKEFDKEIEVVKVDTDSVTGDTYANMKVSGSVPMGALEIMDIRGVKAVDLIVYKNDQYGESVTVTSPETFRVPGTDKIIEKGTTLRIEEGKVEKE